MPLNPCKIRFSTNRIVIVSLLVSLSSHANGQEKWESGANKRTSFRKGAEQFCIARLEASEQTRRFSRIVSLGASYGHGCMGCDSRGSWHAFAEMTDDQFYIRRNFLAYFFASATWSRPEEFSFEALYILENDWRSRPTSLLEQQILDAEGYSGEWIYSPSRDAFGLLSASMKERIFAADPEIEHETQKVGGIERQFGKVTRRDSPVYGTLIRTVPGDLASHGAQPKSVYDLSVDGGFLDVLLRIHGDAAAIEKLEESNWTDAQAREALIEAFAERVASLDAGIVIGVDTLFWDTVFESVARLDAKKPEHPLLRLVLAVIKKTSIAPRIFDSDRRKRVRDDFLEALSRVSKGFNGHAPTPVLIARLADDPISKFIENGYMPVMASLFGQFIEQITGANLSQDILYWLNRVTRGGQLVQASQTDDGSWTLPELGLQLSPKDLRILNDSLEMLRTDSSPAIKSTLTWNGKKLQFAFDPTGDSSVTMLPKSMSGLVEQLFSGVLRELPTFVDAMNGAFSETNAYVRHIGADPTNNIHILNVDEFFENIGSFINPRLAHPSVEGARKMAQMVERTICQDTVQ